MATNSEAASIQSPKQQTLLFIIITAFLSTVGITLVSPVAPFLVGRYVTDPGALGVAVGLLTSIYAVCSFLAAPGLGLLSDRFGRRPILLICLLGSAIGYLLLGVGGALWVLFLGRVIDGITGANFSVAFAYLADITPAGERGKLFGRVGAISGIGLIAGPLIGSGLARFGIEAPLLAAAAITFANVLLGVLFMPESLPKAKRLQTIRVTQLNPFGLLRDVLAVRDSRWLLGAMFLYYLGFAAFTGNLALYTADTLGWDATATGSLFALVGVTDIIVQGLILTPLVNRLGETRTAVGGLVAAISGLALLASVAVLHLPLLAFAGTVIFALGDGLFGPALNGVLSRTVEDQAQGKLQGGSRSIQSLAQAVGPMGGGWAYDRIGYTAPYAGAAMLALLAIGAVLASAPLIKPAKPVNAMDG